MFVKCRSQILMGSSLKLQLLQSTSKQIVFNHSLSTSNLSATQYDDLYADRWAKFQCELISFDSFGWDRIDFLLVRQVSRVFLSVACLETIRSESLPPERISYILYTKQMLKHLIYNISIGSKKTAKKCKYQRGFRGERAWFRRSQCLWIRLRLHVMVFLELDCESLTESIFPITVSHAIRRISTTCCFRLVGIAL